MGDRQEFTFQSQSVLGDKLAHILKICQQINSERNLATLLDLIAREATTLMDADRASIFLLDRERGELKSKVALGSDEMLHFDARFGIAGAVVRSGDTINVEDAHNDNRFYPEIEARMGYRTRSLLAVPVSNHEGEIIGVFEVLNKNGGPFTGDDEEILKALAAQAGVAIETAQLLEALKHHRDELLQENTRLLKDVAGKFSTQHIHGTSAGIQAVRRLIEQISDSSVSVLITGESGTGKELVAKAVHYDSPRARAPFVALNCAALPENLMDSELFGIEKGVATGVERRPGKFELANGGTLFLDEIGDLPAAAQAKLLRVLEERTVERVGGRKAIPVDVRVVAATNKDLGAEIRKGTFREDLYYRLKVVQIHVPPLRERKADIPVLAHGFLSRYCREFAKPPLTLTTEALSRLVTYSWPGNVRELENETKRLVVTVGGTRQLITEEELVPAIGPSGSGEALPSHASALKDAVAELEKEMILKALGRCHQNQQQAARQLGLSRQGLIKKMKRYRILASPGPH